MAGESFQIKGARGEQVPIPAGEYYFNSKARCRRMMLNSLSSDARRVYACLELGTMGFKQELAVVAVSKTKTRPMTPGDIAHQTILSNQNVRRGIAELESEGLAKRESDDGGPLRNGHVVLYSWAIPRQGDKKESSRARLLPDWFPLSWEPFKPLINRFKMSLVQEEVAARDYFEEGERIARDYQKAEEAAARFLKGVCAGDKNGRIRERTERTTERTNGQQVGRSVKSNSTTDLPTPSTQSDPEHLRALKHLLVRMLGGKLQDVPKPKLLREIWHRLKGAPLADLSRRISLRFDSITSFAMVRNLADDCAEAFAEAEQLRSENAKAYAKQQQRQDRELIEDLLRQWPGMDAAEQAYWLEQRPDLQAEIKRAACAGN